MKDIVAIQLKRLERLLKDQRITMDISPLAQEGLAARGYDPVYGARPLKRVIQTEVQNPMAQKILSGDVKQNDHVTVDMKDDAFTFVVGKATGKKAAA